MVVSRTGSKFKNVGFGDGLVVGERNPGPILSHGWRKCKVGEKSDLSWTPQDVLGT